MRSWRKTHLSARRPSRAEDERPFPSEQSPPRDAPRPPAGATAGNRAAVVVDAEVAPAGGSEPVGEPARRRRHRQRRRSTARPRGARRGGAAWPLPRRRAPRPPRWSRCALPGRRGGPSRTLSPACVRAGARAVTAVSRATLEDHARRAAAAPARVALAASSHDRRRAAARPARTLDAESISPTRSPSRARRARASMQELASITSAEHELTAFAQRAQTPEGRAHRVIAADECRPRDPAGAAGQPRRGCKTPCCARRRRPPSVSLQSIADGDAARRADGACSARRRRRTGRDAAARRPPTATSPPSATRGRRAPTSPGAAPRSAGFDTPLTPQKRSRRRARCSPSSSRRRRRTRAAPSEGGVRRPAARRARL